MDKTFSDLTAAVTMSQDDIFPIEQSDGTKQATFKQVCDAIATPEITEQTGEFPEIAAGDSLKVIAGKINKWQQDALTKIQALVAQSDILQEFPADVDVENDDDETVAALKKQVISGLLAYTMNAQIMAVVSDHGTLQADYAIMKREQMASYGYFGVEWDPDELMALVQAEKWDQFAIGDYILDTTSSGEVVQWEIAGKNSWLRCGNSLILEVPHIIMCPRDQLVTRYQYNTTNTNTGGYEASLMPSNLETEANKFSSKLQGYMTQFERLENNKDAWAWAERRITLPSNPELVGYLGFANGYAGGGFNQLPLFKGGNAHILKGRGYNKSEAERNYYWTADPSSTNTTAFCLFSSYGTSSTSGASNEYSVAPLIVLS